MVRGNPLSDFWGLVSQVLGRGVQARVLSFRVRSPSSETVASRGVEILDSPGFARMHHHRVRVGALGGVALVAFSAMRRPLVRTFFCVRGMSLGGVRERDPDWVVGSGSRGSRQRVNTLRIVSIMVGLTSLSCIRVSLSCRVIESLPQIVLYSNR